MTSRNRDDVAGVAWLFLVIALAAICAGLR